MNYGIGQRHFNVENFNAEPPSLAGFSYFRESRVAGSIAKDIDIEFLWISKALAIEQLLTKNRRG